MSVRLPTRRPVGGTIVVAVVISAVAVLALGAPVSAAKPESKHDKILAHWTKERIKAARPREFVRLPGGDFEPAAKPAPVPNAAPANTRGSLWPDGKGQLYRIVGRVLFSMDGGDWICSGVAATDPLADISVVTTAGHCAFDQKNHTFATNWMFFPEFDTTPSYDCSAAVYGCWTADRLVVHSGFANQAGFTSTATLYDWAFAVTGNGGKNGTQLDSLGTFPIAFRSYSSGTSTTATGYPAGGKYAPGQELVYCSGGLAFDFWNANRTYRLSCDMTGGSSGGPWLTSFDASGNSGTLSSLNSYTYSGGTSMYGPKFNAYTQATWAVATNGGTGNAIVP
jgi:hypothetical protein